MSDTWHLKLPIIEAAQSQKHVTHNEALLRLDAIVQLAVIDRDRTGPPPGPTEGDRHLIASGATGAWSGKDDQIAHLQDGVWVFLVPQPGWLCWDMDAGEFVAWTGTEWEVIETGASASAEYERFGINTAPDPINRLSVKSDAVLLSHDDVTPGSGDMRVKLNKDTAADTASFLFQTGWSGRAEFGTTGDDDWRVKVSPDGATWLDALIADRASGTVTLPAGLVVPSVNAGPLAGFRNLLINGDFAINQRGFAGGALAAGTYGHDRWKADAAGASYTVSAGTITLASGALVQVIESPRLAGIAVTLSLENPSADIGVDIAGETATITAGSGRRGVTLTIPSGSTAISLSSCRRPAPPSNGRNWKSVRSRRRSNGDRSRSRRCYVSATISITSQALPMRSCSTTTSCSAASRCRSRRV